MDIQEKQFQKMYLSLGGNQVELEKENGEYTHSKSQMAWGIWQAVKAQVDYNKSCSVASHEIIINETKSELITSYDISVEDEYLLESLVYRGICIGRTQAVFESFKEVT